jgi:Fe2+ transport system protein B
MGLQSIEQKAVYNFEAVRKRIATQAQEYFEPQLMEMGFEKIKIEAQSLQELRQNLDSINEAIKHPESFGTLGFALNARGTVYITKSKSDAQFEIGILPLLLERKKLILERIRLLSSNEKIETIQDLINHVEDEEIKKNLEKQVQDLKNESQGLREQTREVELEQNQERTKTQTELARLNVELFERKTKVWFSLLERESASTIIGGILLIIIVLVQAGSIFIRMRTPVPDIFNNAFLIILGYFFGQSTNKEASIRADAKNEKGI